MAEDNKDEWSSGQPARPNQDNMNITPDLPDFPGSAHTDEAAGNGNDAAASGENQTDATQPTQPVQDTQGFNSEPDADSSSSSGSASNGTSTEVFSTGYRPDTTNSTDVASANTPSDNPYETSDLVNFGNASNPNSDASAYRPAPEYGAYGPLPDHIGNNDNGGNFGNGNAPFGAGNASSSNVPGANGPSMPWNGIFGSAGQNPNVGQNGGNDGNSQNGNGGPYNGGPGRPDGPNGGNFGGPNVQGGGYGNGYAEPKSHNNIITAVVAAVVTAALCLGIGYLGISKGWVTIPASSTMSGITSNKSGSGSATVKGGQAPDWAAVSSQVSNSVVSITTQVSQGIAKGSGAIIDDKGHVVTNNHVVSGGSNIQVTLSNGQMYKADVVGSDNTTDLAVIQLEGAPSGLKPVQFADSSKLAVGENVMAVGNPLGYDDTATTGIVSALNRPVSVMDDNNSEIVTNAVQIDAAINPGNSGGPTFNVAGQVIGINSSIASASSSSGQSGSIGIGFAIPSNLVKRVADQIVSKGSVDHAMLGVTIKSANAESDGITRGGAQITSPTGGGSAVVKGSPADKAGLKANDTVVAFNGQAVGSSSALLGYVRAASLGDKVKLTIVRDHKTMDVDVTLDQKESSVKGSNRSENQKQNSNGQNGQGQNGQGGNSNGDGGGLFDPFGFW
ncbi:trypsin-like peptidase domain-containing protein [Bifidobacterium sp. ESL0769]|uniref:S1C family serine protease n=1 Tax=Bifidobacterium sp. ESL0769 TaxID=2983229 RepID=UPI0023F88D7E|nr:trypsin-like peptidase domain-containing protein [Bifidobacterium sp. ESL0769]WEV67379.1 trypsin-like peptidase domain-containing protein [Bifidobacterium sp. ESL0769]